MVSGPSGLPYFSELKLQKTNVSLLFWGDDLLVELIRKLAYETLTLGSLQKCRLYRNFNISKSVSTHVTTSLQSLTLAYVMQGLIDKLKQNCVMQTASCMTLTK